MPFKGLRSKLAVRMTFLYPALPGSSPTEMLQEALGTSMGWGEAEFPVLSRSYAPFTSSIPQTESFCPNTLSPTWLGPSGSGFATGLILRLAPSRMAALSSEAFLSGKMEARREIAPAT